MKVVADGETTEYDQVQKWWYIRADDQCKYLPMAVIDSLPMTLEESVEVADWFVVVSRSVTGGSLMFSLVIRIRFVYGFRLVWNASPSRVWL